MRRRNLSDEELDIVINLRQNGASWLNIQRQTRIPRRAAKRGYEKWERDQSSNDLKIVRINVVTEEFHKHLRTLIKVSDSLVDYLPETLLFDETRSAEEFLNGLWMRNIEEPESVLPWRLRGDKAQRRTIRQNLMLFKSLQDHTRGEIRWQALEIWKQAWNKGTEILTKLRTESRETVDNILEQKPEVKDRIKKESADIDIHDGMVKGVLEAIWQGILSGKPEQGYELVQITESGQQGATVTFAEKASVATVLPFSDKDLAEEVAGVCRWAADNLRKGDIIQLAITEVHTMRESVRKLEEMLDPLVLRPIIIRTRCDLCPI